MNLITTKLLAGIIGLILLVGCQDDTRPIRDLYLNDISDNDSLSEVTSHIMYDHYTSSVDPWAGYLVGYMSLADTDIRPLLQWHIPAEESFFGFEDKRQEQIELMGTLIDEWEVNDDGAYNQSVILRPLIGLINDLSEHTRDSTTIYLISDLESNNPTLNVCTDKKQRQLVLDEPERIEHIIESLMSDCVSAPHVHLVIIHQPNAENNSFHRAMVEIYQRVFKKIDVSVSAIGSLEHINH